MASQLFDSRSHLDAWESEDTTMLSMSQEIDEHTVQLRKAVLASVASIRTRIHQQTADLVEREREEARETQRRLLQQVESLTRLVEGRNSDLERERTLNERLVTMISNQKRRSRERALAAEALQRWSEHVKAKKYRKKMCAHLTEIRKERQSRALFSAWRVEAERQKAQQAREKLAGEHKRAVARLTTEFQTAENKMKLELLALREQLAKEEERQNLLQEKHKAAFMRGVCALNLEAMQAIRQGGSEDDISVASFMQGLNVSGAFSPSQPSAMSAQPPTNDRLLEQQLVLHRRLQQYEDELGGAPRGADPGIRPATAGQEATAQPAPTPRNEPRVTVVVNPKYSSTAMPTSSGASKPSKAPLRPSTNLGAPTVGGKTVPRLAPGMRR